MHWKLTVFLLFFFCPTSEAQWLQSSTAVQGGVTEISYPSLDAAYAARGGQLLKSTNGGENWTEIKDFGVFTVISQIIFFNRDTGIVNGTFGGLQVTYDGGQNWQALNAAWPVTGTISPYKIKKYKQTLYANIWHNDTTYIIRSVDFGASFQKVFSNYEPLVGTQTMVSFCDSNTAFFVNRNNDSSIFRTSNLFQNIDTLPLFFPSTNMEIEMDFIDTFIGHFYGYYGQLSFPTRIKNTTNSYANYFNDLDGNGILPVLDIAFNVKFPGSPTRIYACSEYGKIFESTNSGYTWAEQETPFKKRLDCIAFFDKDHGIAGGLEGIIYTKNGSTPLAIKQFPKNTKPILIWPNPASNNLNFKIATNDKIESIEVVTIDGKNISVSMNPSVEQLDISNLPAGTYFLELRTSRGVWRNVFTKE